MQETCKGTWSYSFFIRTLWPSISDSTSTFLFFIPPLILQPLFSNSPFLMLFFFSSPFLPFAFLLLFYLNPFLFPLSILWPSTLPLSLSPSFRPPMNSPSLIPSASISPFFVHVKTGRVVAQCKIYAENCVLWPHRRLSSLCCPQKTEVHKDAHTYRVSWGRHRAL